MDATIPFATTQHKPSAWTHELTEDASLVLRQSIERAAGVADVLAEHELTVRVQVSVTLHAEDGTTVADLTLDAPTTGVRGGGQWWPTRQAWQATHED